MDVGRFFAVLLLSQLAGCQTAPVASRDHSATSVEALKRSGNVEPRTPVYSGYSQVPVQQASFVEPAKPITEQTPEATTVTSESGRLTLLQFENIALSNNPTLRLARIQIEKERGTWTQVGLYPNPVAGYLRSDPSNMSGSRTNGAFVQQTFVTAGKLRLAREEEAFGIQESIQGFEAQEQRVLNDLRARFYDVLGAQYTLDVALKMEKIAADGLDAAQRAEKAKQSSRIYTVRSEMQLKRIRLAIRNAEDQYAAAWQHLADMAGSPDMAPVSLVGTLDDAIPNLDENEEWERLRRESPLLKQLRSQVGLTRKAWELARAQRIPDITGQVVVERDSTNQFTSVQSLVALPVPIFNRNQGAIYTACNEIRRAEMEIERTELALRDGFTVTFRQYASARNHVEALKTDILPGAQENLDLTTRGYAGGEFSLFDVLDARQLFFDTLLDYSSALTELRVAVNEVVGMQLTGGLNPAEIGTALQGAEGAATQRRAVQQLLQQQDRGQLKKFTPGTTGE